MVSKNRKIKSDKIHSMQEGLKDAQTFVLLHYSQLTVQKTEKLRKSIHEIGGKVSIYKNTLLKLALNKTPLMNLQSYLRGPIMVIHSPTKSLNLLKTIWKFTHQHKSLSMIAGYFDHSTLDTQSLEELANLPTREESLGHFVSLLSTGLSNLIILLQSKEKRISTESVCSNI